MPDPDRYHLGMPEGPEAVHRTTLRVANAPVSFGVFELTVDREPLVGPDRFLDLVASIGYAGVDLGPVGYLGGARELPARLGERGLGLAGGWVAFTFSDEARFRRELADLDGVLDLFEAAAGDDPLFRPKPTLADAGSPDRRGHLGRPSAERGLGEDRWPGFLARIGEVADRVRSRGLEPTFHHHMGTYVESSEEIDRLLEGSDIGLCLDAGHLLAAGGDPVDALGRWHGRINHLHVKDCHLDVVEQIVAEDGPVDEIWTRRAFCALGTGDLDLDAFLGTVAASSCAGWVVVEQDVVPLPGDRPEPIAEEQAANLEWLHRYGLP